LSQSEILNILKEYKNNNAEKYGINKLGIFGSFSKDIAKDKSDIDIIIETKEPDIFKLVHIKDDLEQVLHRSIDIVRNRENMNPYLKKRIDKDAIYV
jgi:uncharacterized protein